MQTNRKLYTFNNQIRLILFHMDDLKGICLQEDRSSRYVLKNFAKFTGNHWCQSFFFNEVAGLRPATLIKKRLCHRCFPVNFAKFLRTAIFIETSGGCLWEEAINPPFRNFKRNLITEVMKRSLSYPHGLIYMDVGNLYGRRQFTTKSSFLDSTSFLLIYSGN